MLHKDWERLQRQVQAREQPWPPFREIGSACIGIAAAAFIAWTQWEPVYSGLTTQARADNYWQGAFLGIASVAFLLVALVMLVAEILLRGQREQLQTLLTQDMEDIFRVGTADDIEGDASDEFRAQ
jgi:hypothetical protein